jgi:hypothetical protein
VTLDVVVLVAMSATGVAAEALSLWLWPSMATPSVPRVEPGPPSARRRQVQRTAPIAPACQADDASGWAERRNRS